MTATTAPGAPTEDGARVGRRLLAHVAPGGVAVPLAEHRLRLPAPRTPGRKPLVALIDEVERSGLRGRGGAAFPTATKLRAVAEQGRRPVVVVNGMESEPLSAKDRLLLMTAPHLVLDGAVTAATATGASTVIVAVKRTARGSWAALHRAIEERGQRDGVDVRVAALPSRYVAGEETAVIHALNGGPAKPTLVPPRPFERGVDGRPTLVQNVETLAHLAQIAARGADWFREAGTPEEPGTTLLTVGNRVFEAPFGAELGSVLRSAGTEGPLAGVLVGGYFGTWLAPDALEGTRLSQAALHTLGASLGSGAIAPLAATQCGLVDAARVVHWLAHENAGQCGPCVNGLPAIAAGFARVVAGRADEATLQQLERWCGDVEGRGACRHPDGAVRFLRSAMRVFEADLRAHVDGRPCAGVHARPVLPVPPTGEEW